MFFRIIAVGFFFSLSAWIALAGTDLSLAHSSRISTIAKLHFACEMDIVLIFCLPPGFAASLAFWRWSVHKSKFFNGWLSVGMAAFLANLLNPLAWFLIASSFFLLGVWTLGAIGFTSVLLAIAGKFVRIRSD